MASVHVAHATYFLDVALVSQNQAGNYSTINIHIHAQTDSGWSGFANNIGWSATGNSGAFSFNGTTAEIANYNMNVGHDGAGNYSGTITSHTNATGTSSYGGPTDMAQGISLPRIPKPPGAPSISASEPVGRNVTINIGIPAGYDEGGSAVSNLVSQYSLNGGAWTGTTNGGWGARTYSSLPPGSYVFRAYAQNGVGNSSTVQTAAVIVRSGGKIRVAAAWISTIVKVRSSATWKDATLKIRSGGVWKDPA